MTDNCKTPSRNHRTICVSFCQDEYGSLIENVPGFRSHLDQQIEQFPELFPQEVVREGYQMKDIRVSKKLGVKIRRIQSGRNSYGIQPSFVFPRMSAVTKEVEKGLFFGSLMFPIGL